MLDLVGEVSERAHWDGLLGRILRVTVGLSLVRHNHLRVGLGAESTGLEQWLLVPNTLLVDVESSLNVVDGVDDEVETFPEVVIEKIFSLRGDEGLMGCDLEGWVHVLGLAAGSLSLRFADIWLSEEELTIEVGHLDVVIVGHSDGTISASESHESHSLDVFAAESSGADHESLGVSELFLDLTTVDSDLVVVSAIHWSSVGFAFRQRLEAIVVSPLLQWHVLSCELDDFLGNESTEHSALRSDRALRKVGNLGHDLLINFLKSHRAFALLS